MFKGSAIEWQKCKCKLAGNGQSLPLKNELNRGLASLEVVPAIAWVQLSGFKRAPAPRRFVNWRSKKKSLPPFGVVGR